MDMPNNVKGDSEWENHFNLMCAEAVAVKVSLFSQKCLLVERIETHTTSGPMQTCPGKAL